MDVSSLPPYPLPFDRIEYGWGDLDWLGLGSRLLFRSVLAVAAIGMFVFLGIGLTRGGALMML